MCFPPAGFVVVVVPSYTRARVGIMIISRFAARSSARHRRRAARFCLLLFFSQASLKIDQKSSSNVVVVVVASRARLDRFAVPFGQWPFSVFKVPLPLP